MAIDWWAIPILIAVCMLAWKKARDREH